MKIDNTIGAEGCACGDYESENLKATASCRKSGSSPDSDDGVGHLLQYEIKNGFGHREIGDIIDNMFAFSVDFIRVEQKEL